MDDNFQDILDSLPEKRSRSRLLTSCAFGRDQNGIPQSAEGPGLVTK